MRPTPYLSFRSSHETTCSVFLADGSTIRVAGDRRARLRGLTGLDRLADDQALLIERCRSVHTAGMRFALDLLWLDAAGAVIRLDANVRPRRLRTCARARAVIETNAGCGERFAGALADGAMTRDGRVVIPTGITSRYHPSVRVTTKGQVTIPQRVREKLGITAGSEVDFQLDDAGARLVRVNTGEGTDLAAGMRGRATVRMSTEEIMALTRGDD